MKTSRIAKYSLTIFVLLTALSTFTTMVIGVDNLSLLTLGEFSTYQLLPPFILATIIYTLMAKRRVSKAWYYAATVFLFNALLVFLITSLLMQELYIPPTWFIDQPLSLASTVFGTLISLKWGNKGTVDGEYIRAAIVNS